MLDGKRKMKISNKKSSHFYLFSFYLKNYPIKIPAIVAVISVASIPPRTARKPSDAISFLRCGANGEIPPICIAIDEKLANPQSAYVAIKIPLSVNAPLLTKFANSKYATNSLRTI